MRCRFHDPPWPCVPAGTRMHGGQNKESEELKRRGWTAGRQRVRGSLRTSSRRDRNPRNPWPIQCNPVQSSAIHPIHPIHPIQSNLIRLPACPASRRRSEPGRLGGSSVNCNCNRNLDSCVGRLLPSSTPPASGSDRYLAQRSYSAPGSVPAAEYNFPVLCFSAFEALNRDPQTHCFLSVNRIAPLPRNAPSPPPPPTWPVADTPRRCHLPPVQTLPFQPIRALAGSQPHDPHPLPRQRALSCPNTHCQTRTAKHARLRNHGHSEGKSKNCVLQSEPPAIVGK
ncbi:hypothetical protein FN846DRAFT_109816 [Sphaerosporella brunnea]|uniref:Uncharacterized protein n=1 Tax=Sphaerosporella brunnea TaxID=1250544 RepID=A0A5J5ESD1_9PEZI|nr:hypothetical protein FN846DRAFT_109816 [Sphaerosporella brunnea]